MKNEDIDQIEVITSPQNGNFRSIEQYYQNFDQITDKQVIDIIKKFIVITNFEQGLFDSLLKEDSNDKYLQKIDLFTYPILVPESTY